MIIPEHSLLITQAENGYVLTHKVLMDKDEISIARTVIESEHNVTMGDERETMTWLLEAVSEHFGIPYDKFGQENLNITWNNKGNHVE